jgi:hypothetical protein
MSDAGGHDPNLSVAWIAGLAAFGSASITAAAGWLAQRLVGKAAWEQMVANANKDLIESLRAERQDVRNEFSAYKAEAEQRRQRLSDEFEAYKIHTAAESAQLRGEIINMTQAMQGLRARYRELGGDIPEDRYPPAALSTLADDGGLND